MNSHLAPETPDTCGEVRDNCRRQCSPSGIHAVVANRPRYKLQQRPVPGLFRHGLLRPDRFSASLAANATLFSNVSATNGSGQTCSKHP
jgi:hypothetical protein